MRIQTTIAPRLLLAVLAVASALIFTACATTSYREYPVLDRYSDGLAFVGMVDSLEFRTVEKDYRLHLAARVQVTHSIFGEPPNTVWLGLPYPPHRRGQWCSVGDGIVAVVYRQEPSAAIDERFWPLYARYYHGPVSVDDQTIYELDQVDATRMWKACGDNRPTIQGLASLVDRAWRPEDMTLAELTADMSDFYNRRQYWRWRHRGFNRVPWQERPNAAEEDALETWKE